MNISYYVLDPTSNITILAETPVPVELQPSVASRLMLAEPEAEQTGFLSNEPGCDIALRMAGGEFCGNAAMSAAVIAATRKGEESSTVVVSVSGAPHPVSVKIKKQSDGSWFGTVNMPRPIGYRSMELPGVASLPVVSFPGITHVIVEFPMEKSKAESLIREWCAFLGADALGIMILNRAESRLYPLVYVPSAGTLFWEKSCASGTTAVGAFLAAESGKTIEITLQQPGGNLTIAASETGDLLLSGTVRIRRHAVF